MEREYTNENFEHFLKKSTDNLRMKAPDRVWENLSKELNKRRRRFILGISALLLISVAIGYYITSNVPQQANVISKSNQQQVAAIVTGQEKKQHTVNDAQPLLNQKIVSLRPNLSKKEKAYQKEFIAINSAPIIETSVQIENLHNSKLSSNSTNENNFTPTVVDSYSEFEQNETGNKKEIKQNDLAVAELPLTIESVMNVYKAKKSRKLETQLYFSPTISYRKLTENKSYLRTLHPGNLPSYYAALNSSVSNNVTHKPDVGFELGFATKFPVSNRLKIRSGIQFNVNRYDVKAFSSPLAIATIALNNGPTVDSLSTISGYSNIQGYKSNWLQNFSFQISAPIGIEYNFSSSDKLQFGLATTIQPTYVLGDRAYLITTDYKSYTQVPWLIRRWNVNTAFEAFVKYKAWQFGPQIRYQLLSSFDSKYPVKENLFDFGLKVGVTLNK